ncbi:MAG: archease [Deferrisomatales bacterium]|nr:archease [Deferrisomatales bacterium]
MAPWRALDHTADLELEASAPTPEGALEELCCGLLAHVTDPDAVEPREGVLLEAEGLDPAETLVSALGELLYWLNVRGWVFRRCEALEVTPTRIRLRAWGEPRDPARHPFDLEVKAATYHDLAFGPEAEGGPWRARVLFDV